MSNDFDSRAFDDRTHDEREEQLRERAVDVSDALLGEHRISVVSFDSATGNAAVVVSHRTEPGGTDYVARALEHVQRIGPALGLAPEQPPEYQADPAVQVTSAGGAAVHLRQLYKGIAIYEASATVRFDTDGRLTEVAGRNHTVATDLAVAPAVPAEGALKIAAEHVAASQDLTTLDPFGQPLGIPIDLSGFDPKPLAVAVETPDRAQTFAASPFNGASTVRLVWFPHDSGLRLAWQVLLQIEHGPQYRVIVDAADATVLLQVQLARSIAGAADVFLRGGGEPRQRVAFPVPTTEFGVAMPNDVTAGEPSDWLIGVTTGGSNTIATLATTGQTVSGTSSGGSVVFAPADAEEQLVVNLFTLCGVMHDALYALGFREADGNFQVDNRGRGGVGSDRVTAIAHPGTVWGTANMATPPDGMAPTMNMGLVESSGRHTALDPDVVFHEYTHGLSNRLVGGPLDTTALDAPQSGGMGEGWGDYFACTLLGRDTVGSWVVGSPLGIRRFRYDTDFPDTFADLGSGRYTGVHAIGELWCATLIELNRRIGAPTAMQLVVDAMKLASSNPGFLAMRDAILVAARDFATSRGLGVNESGALTDGIWEAFARFGMGPGAKSVEATLGPVTADFSVPRTAPGPSISRTVNPALPIPDNDPNGVASSITLDASGVVTAASVAVRITHTYRGDLVVRLRPPSAPAITLHDRSGGSADDLVQTWTSDDEALDALVGRAAAGTWTLEVSDRARRDVGALDQWTLELTTAAVRPSRSGQAMPGLVIPDNQAGGVTSEIELTGGEPIRGLTVELDLTHTYIGDLTVTLAGPTGAVATLHDRAGGSSDNLIRRYASGDSDLTRFLDLPVGGTWALHVADHEARDIGKLNAWSLHAEL